MKRVLFLFLDGVGLGEDDASTNPLCAGEFPTLSRLTGGVALTRSAGRVTTAEADLLPLDACMDVEGRPQSATGQASLLTGRNVAAAIGEHYGPRPDDRVREQVLGANLFAAVQKAGLGACFCNAYPPGFFNAVERGKRLLSVIQYAARSSGLRLMGKDDLVERRAISVGYTNRSWREQLGMQDVPVYSPHEAGVHFWHMARTRSFVLHDHWLTDVVGHHEDLAAAVEDLQTFDGFLGGLLSVADLDETLIVIASDHGNVEDCSHSKHTLNPALGMLIGNRAGLPVDETAHLYDVAPLVKRFLGIG